MKAGQFSLRKLLLIVAIISFFIASFIWSIERGKETQRDSLRRVLLEVEFNPAITPDLVDEACELLGDDEYRALNAERQRRFEAQNK